MRRARLLPARMRPRRGLVRRHHAPGPAWKSIGLGWRKATRSLPGVPARAQGRLTVRQSWSPRLHFHFDIRSIGAPRAAPNRGAPGKPAATILWRRIDARLTALLPVLRTTATRDWRSIAHRVERALLTRWRGRRGTSWSEVVRMSRTTVRPPGPIGRPAPGASAATIFRRGRVVAAPPPRRAAPLRLEPRLLRPARRGAASPAGEGALPAAATDAPVRPPELVWRSEAGERPAEVAERVVRAAAASMSPLPAAAAAASSWPPPEAVEALRPRLIDGALIDRLAENVIGRVEKKIRIERERRGV